MYVYLLGLALSNLCVLLTAIPALMDIAGDMDSRESYAIAFFQVIDGSRNKLLLTTAMGREFCKFKTGFEESQKAYSARADSPGILTFFS